MGEYGALEQCLREGFIDYTVEADQRYVPKILTNNKDKKRKVLDTILSQLYVCDSFLFSVAFLTKSGIACLKDALIQNRTATGKILASQYLNFTERCIAGIVEVSQCRIAHGDGRTGFSRQRLSLSSFPGRAGKLYHGHWQQ